MGTDRAATQPHSRLVAAAFIGLAVLLAGCTREVSMAETRTPEQVDVTIQYSAVRSGARLFGDYSVVDSQILTEPAAGVSAGEPSADASAGEVTAP